MFKTLINSLILPALLVSGSTLAKTPLPPKMPSKALDIHKPLTSIALGSCFAPQLEQQQIFNTIKKAQPDVFLYLGDNVYQSKETSEMDLPNLKAGYQLLSQSKSFASLRKAIPLLPIWDDHDYGLNDAGGSYKPKHHSEEIFNHVWEMAKIDDDSKTPGVYYSKTIGPKGQRVQLIMLDTRFFRSDLVKVKKPKPLSAKFLPNNDTTTTMLGQIQWQWLENQLEQPADLRLLVSSVQVLTSAGWSEGWHLFPHEQQRLIKLLAKQDKLLIVSGDRHFANFYQKPLANGKVLTEFTSSSLNLPITGKAKTVFEQHIEPYQLAAGIYEANFGMITIDWENKQLAMKIIDGGGKAVRTQKMNF